MDNLNPVQDRIAQLEIRGWAPASIARELNVTRDAVGKWKRAKRYPSTETLVLDALDRLLKRKYIPKKKLYTKGSRRKSTEVIAVRGE